MSMLLPRLQSESTQLAAEIHDELQCHLEETAAALIEEGWLHDAAWAEAHRRFGDLRTITKSCYRERSTMSTTYQKLNLLLIVALIGGVAFLTVRSNHAAESHQKELAQLKAAIKDLEGSAPAVFPAVNADGGTLGKLAAATVESLPKLEEQVAAFETERGTPLSEDVRLAALSWLSNKTHAGPKLAAFGDEAVPILVAVLDGKIKVEGSLRESMRFVAANHLGDTQSPAAVEPLLAALKDPWFNVRRCAALALAKLGDSRAIAPLETLAAHDPYVYRGNQEKGPIALVRIDAEKALDALR